MKLSDYIENAPFLRERSSLTVQCIKTPVGYFFEEGSTLKYLDNNDIIRIIDDLVYYWAVLPDCRLIYSIGLFGCENNGFTIISPGNNGDERIIGEIVKDLLFIISRKTCLSEETRKMN